MKITKKAQVTFYISFIIMAIILCLIGAIIIPFGTLFTIEAYKGGEQIWNMTEPRISQIKDTAVRNAVYDAVQESKDSTETNVEMVSDIYQYSWIIILVILALVSFLFTRKNVEVGGGAI